MSEVTVRMMRRQPTRTVSDWVQDAEVGECIIYRGWPHRLAESRGRNKRAAGELTPVKIRGPRRAIGIRQVNATWYWVLDKTPEEEVTFHKRKCAVVPEEEVALHKLRRALIPGCPYCGERLEGEPGWCIGEWGRQCSQEGFVEEDRVVWCYYKLNVAKLIETAKVMIENGLCGGTTPEDWRDELQRLVTKLERHAKDRNQVNKLKTIFCDFDVGPNHEGLIPLDTCRSLKSFRTTKAHAGENVLLFNGDEGLWVKALLIKQDDVMYGKFDWNDIQRIEEGGPLILPWYVTSIGLGLIIILVLLCLRFCSNG